MFTYEINNPNLQNYRKFYPKLTFNMSQQTFLGKSVTVKGILKLIFISMCMKQTIGLDNASMKCNIFSKKMKTNFTL